MITLFIDIINGLKGFDQKFTNSELVSKILRSLSEDWNSLRMLIEYTKNVNIYLLEKLYRILMTYELNNVETKEKTEKKSKEEIKEPPKRHIALKSTNDEHSSNMNISDEEFDDLVLLVKKWRGFQNNRKFQKKKDKDEKKNKKIICYDCDKSGHKRTECPNKKKFTKKKALQATWDDSDEDDHEEDEIQEEIVNMCFMAIEDETATSLSYAGRAELIRVVLQGVECFWISILPIPAAVIDHITRLYRNFLWGSKKPLVAWRDVCLPKS
ncbi:CCHC-type domain-containing protein [Abeliophyllum distichum]|uniref:CCHC-type domain-containing protein n=1 Tax=Abeliophyllum distichum TaxID=126358 RepID=A0ABD1U125_9LAMI